LRDIGGPEIDAAPVANGQSQTILQSSGVLLDPTSNVRTALLPNDEIASQ
jgi:hypothetical protein